jgi:hypothetical protein
LLDVIEGVDLSSTTACKSLEELILIEEHHELEKFILGNLHWNFLKGIVLVETGALKILPFEVLTQGELVAKTEGAVRVLSLQTAFEIKYEEETGVDVVLNREKRT